MSGFNDSINPNGTDYGNSMQSEPLDLSKNSQYPSGSSRSVGLSTSCSIAPLSSNSIQSNSSILGKRNADGSLSYSTNVSNNCAGSSGVLTVSKSTDLYNNSAYLNSSNVSNRLPSTSMNKSIGSASTLKPVSTDKFAALRASQMSNTRLDCLQKNSVSNIIRSNSNVSRPGSSGTMTNQRSKVSDYHRDRDYRNNHANTQRQVSSQRNPHQRSAESFRGSAPG